MKCSRAKCASSATYQPSGPTTAPATVGIRYAGNQKRSAPGETPSHPGQQEATVRRLRGAHHRRAGTESQLPGRPNAQASAAREAHSGTGRAAPLPGGRRRLLPARRRPTPRSRPAPRAPLQPAVTGKRAHPPRPSPHTHRSQGDARRHTPPPEPSHKDSRAARACAEGSAPGPGRSGSGSSRTN